MPSQNCSFPAHSPSAAPTSLRAKPAPLQAARPCLVCPCCYPISSVSFHLCLSLFIVPQMYQMQSHFRAFARAVPSAWTVLPLIPTWLPPSSFKFKIEGSPRCPSLSGFFLLSPRHSLTIHFLPFHRFIVCFLHWIVSFTRAVILVHFVYSCVPSAQHGVWHRYTCVE